MAEDGRRGAVVRMKQKGVRRRVEGGSKKLRVKNFMLNFMPMKISCSDELFQYYFWNFSCLRPPLSAFRHSSI
jgi:hypothetical protein